MSVTHAEQLANEWEWYVRQYAKKRGKPDCGWRLILMIEHDLETTEPGCPNKLDLARQAAEILKERLKP